MLLLRTALLILLLCFGQQSQAFDDLKNVWNFDLLYHYARIERTTLLQTDNFQSRQGVMLQFQYEDQIDLFWRWYFGGDVTFARYEAASTVSFTPRNQIPAQLYLGTGLQLGDLKSFEIFGGLGGSTEHYFNLVGPNQFEFESTYALRAHLGFSWRFLSITSASAKLLFRYSLPVTPVEHNGADITYRGILDGSMRLRGRYDSLLSLYGGIRFEDYQTSNQSLTYFTSRIYAGVGFHFR